MPTYVLMTKLGDSEMTDPRGRKKAGQRWKRRVEEVCPQVKWLAHYALLGPYDFMDIYEAPDDAAAFRVSLVSREEGAVSAESWPAMTYDEFLEVAGAVEDSERRGGKKKK